MDVKSTSRAGRAIVKLLTRRATCTTTNTATVGAAANSANPPKFVLSEDSRGLRDGRCGRHKGSRDCPNAYPTPATRNLRWSMDEPWFSMWP